MAIDGETTAWLCGMGCGVIVGAVCIYILHRHAFEFGNAMVARNSKMRVLLQALQLAEGRYRQKSDTLGERHPATCAAWDEMREAGNAARMFLMTGCAQ